jgi:hypothetical protein
MTPVSEPSLPVPSSVPSEPSPVSIGPITAVPFAPLPFPHASSNATRGGDE